MEDPGPEMHLVIPGTPLAVRQGLLRLLADPFVAGMEIGARDRAELVLAEVLNNIVEHAYAGQSGEIALRLRWGAHGLDCCVCDCGCAMPGLCPPPGGLADWDPAAPPEGGFGWHLIHLLTEELHYDRIGNRNVLHFHLPDRPLPT